MSVTSTHFLVPVAKEDRAVCLGPDGSAAHVARALRMLQGRWKLPILFRLYAEPSTRTLQLKRDLATISQKMLTQQLRALEADRLLERTDFQEAPPRVEYRLTDAGRRLLHALIAVRDFAADLA